MVLTNYADNAKVILGVPRRNSPLVERMLTDMLKV